MSWPESALWTHWITVLPSRLGLSSKGCNAHFKISAWTITVLFTPGCASESTCMCIIGLMSEKSRTPPTGSVPLVNIRVGQQVCCKYQVCYVQVGLSNGVPCSISCGATMAVDVRHHSVWVSSCRLAPIHSSWALGWTLPPESQAELGVRQFAVCILVYLGFVLPDFERCPNYKLTALGRIITNAQNCSNSVRVCFKGPEDYFVNELLAMNDRIWHEHPLCQTYNSLVYFSSHCLKVGGSNQQIILI